MAGYISRSVAGSYDNEAIAIFLLMLTFFLWIRALKTGSAFWAALTALFYFYMVAAWGITTLNFSDLRWIRLYHEYVAITRFHPHSHGSLFFSFIRRLFNVLCPWNARINANPLCRIHASSHFRTHGCLGYPNFNFHSDIGIFGLLQLIAFTQLIRSLLPSK